MGRRRGPRPRSARRRGPADLPRSGPVGAELAARGTSVRDLIAHTSGLPHDLTLTDGGLDAADGREAVAGIGALDASELGPRGQRRYSSLGYVLLQAVVETVTGRPFAESPGVVAGAVPPGHVPFVTEVRAVDVTPDPAGLAYGYQAGSAEQLGGFAADVLRDRLADGGPARSGPARSDLARAAWNIETREAGGEVLWHSGAVPGYFAHVAVAPERDRAVVVMANRYGELDAGTFAAATRTLVDHRLGAPLRDGPGPGPQVLVPAGLIAGIVATLAAAVVVRRRGALSGAAGWRGAAARLGVMGVGVAAAGMLLVGVPALLGADLAVVHRWAPDVAAGLVCLAASVLALAAAFALPRTAKSATPSPDRQVPQE